MAGSFDSQGTRANDNTRESVATRDIVCFEVLDYDSITAEGLHVVGLIYKKVTIKHSQTRVYKIKYSSTSGWNNIKNFYEKFIQEYDWTPATDFYDWSGTRDIEYLFCLIVNGIKYTKSLGSVNIASNGSLHQSGKNRELIEQGAVQGSGFDPSTFEETNTYNATCTGERLYGVSVNVGVDMATYSYDLEESKGVVEGIDYDSPVNYEDYNNNWTKKSRVVGAMNYYGVEDQKTFLYEGTAEQRGFSGTAGFPDKVMAVSYLGG